MASKREAAVTWHGELLSGNGTGSAKTSRAFTSLPVTWGSRTEAADGRTSPEELVAAARYGYSHSQVFSDNFPTRPFNGDTPREIVLLTFDRPVSSEEATAEAAKQGLERPYYEDALYFGSSTRRSSWKGRWPSSMTHGWATTDAAMPSVSGITRVAVSWA